LSTALRPQVVRAVRAHLRLEPGDRIKFFIHPDGSVVILPKVPALALKGMVRAPRKRVSLAAMDRAIAEGAASRRR
jgi:antitoxin PrlF